MTETLTHLTRPYAPDSPLAYLLDLAADADGPSEDEQRDDAQTTAAHHIYQDYPHTLAHVLEVTDWQGYPAWEGADGRRFEPSAMAWLDGGLWLHHTLHISETDGARDVLTLIVPCTCGRGYIDVLLDTEDDLIELLSELRPTHGRSPHTDTPVDCHSVRTAPTFMRLAR
ncbi:hypothetical protein [Streptomyces sp. AC555_RSS877]|uniref:hypothetical protein n=1 Tax=Streptomyces sp. AC555_RSS877 TaxID=2823688 RepID=UPI001C268E43|nr:hypothetical protein [Streptomyces sp. AC555_RSS877]